ncbi:hypothetical protein ACFXKI_02290 [Streptomyces mirabilis]|uniref:hypothetical protein n=2 Tax=Streptomyces mirabilis TaxID=68239 RepID=UPI003681575F
MKISGSHTVRAVDAGGGTAADFAELDVRGKAAVVGLAAGVTPDEALANATKAGAGYVIAYRKTPGYWIASVKSATIPLMIATGEDGARLAGLLGTGRTVKLKLDGTPVSPYVYNVMFPQTGAVSKNQTYPLDSSTTVRQTVRYHGNRAGRIAKDTVYRYRPWQSADIETTNEVRLGTVRTEYYNVSADTRIWHAVHPDWQANRPQWNSVRTFAEAGKLPAEDWLRQVVRPATSAQYGLSARTGDQLTSGAGRTSDVSLTVRNQEGSVTSGVLKAWVSYDDGSSWKEVKVKHGKAEIRHPKKAECVSLRVLASDAAGNRIDQTVLRAYGLK